MHSSRLLMESGLLRECVRVLVEMPEPEPGAALQVELRCTNRRRSRVNARRGVPCAFAPDA